MIKGERSNNSKVARVTRAKLLVSIPKVCPCREGAICRGQTTDRSAGTASDRLAFLLRARPERAALRKRANACEQMELPAATGGHRRIDHFDTPPRSVYLGGWTSRVIMPAYGSAARTTRRMPTGIRGDRGLILTLPATKGRIIVGVNSCLCRTPQSTQRVKLSQSHRSPQPPPCPPPLPRAPLRSPSCRL